MSALVLLILSRHRSPQRPIDHWKTLGLNHHLNINMPASRTCEMVTSSRDDSVLCKTRLPKALAKMTHLTEISITHRRYVDFSALEKTFGRSNVCLTSVVGLRIQCPGDWYFLVEACPNTEKLILRDNLFRETLMEVVGNLKKLAHLELFYSAWGPEDIHRRLPVWTKPQLCMLTGFRST